MISIRQSETYGHDGEFAGIALNAGVFLVQGDELSRPLRIGWNVDEIPRFQRSIGEQAFPFRQILNISADDTVQIHFFVCVRQKRQKERIRLFLRIDQTETFQRYLAPKQDTHFVPNRYEVHISRWRADEC